MAEMCVSGIAKEVLRKLNSSLLQDTENGIPVNIKDEIAKLKVTMTNVLSNSEAEKEAPSNSGARNSLRKLRYALYDADNQLDELLTKALRQKVPVQVEAVRVQTSISSSKKVPDFFSQQFRKIKLIREELDEIAVDKPNYDCLERVRGYLPFTGRMRPEIVSREAEPTTRTHSFLPASSDHVIGRDQKRDDIVRFLIDDDPSTDLSVVSVVGIAGIGKSTLANLVYDDGRVISHFQLRMWVRASGVFDVEGLIKRIVESATDWKQEDSSNLDLMINHAREMFHGKRYLLVLDDAWIEDVDKWSKLRDLVLAAGAQGSKIIVTTRTDLVAATEGTVRSYQLEGLPDDLCWSLFRKLSFGEVENEEVEHPNLVAIGKEIVKQCAGVPLAIKTLGSRLHSKTNEGDWQRIRDSLELRYDMLPSNLKNCFAYCSIYPTDCTIDKKTLIQLWMAQGLIDSSSENDNLEDIGNIFVGHLFNIRFFQNVRMDDYGEIKSFKLPALVHDLAQSVAGTEYAALDVDNNGKDISKHIYHVSFCSSLSVSTDVPSSLFKAVDLRTLFIPVKCWQEVRYLHEKLVSSFKRLRALDLHNFGIEEVPDSIGELNHLRYLDLSMNRIRKFPSSITSLLNLQTLKLLNCEALKELPADMRNMISLRHIEINCTARLTHMPSQMGSLTHLRSLPVFVVGMVDASSTYSCSALSELHGLNQLRGKLRISNLDNASASDSNKAILMNKQYLQALELAWNQDSPRKYARTYDGISKDDNVLLEGLQPHANLKELFLNGYAGSDFPEWMMKIGSSLTPQLVKMSLSNCNKCERLPAFTQLPSLKILTLRNLQALVYFHNSSHPSSPSLSAAPPPPRFPSLEQLSLIHMPKFLGWEPQGIVPLFPCLTKLIVGNCPDLEHLPLPLQNFSKLEMLKIQWCPKLDLSNEKDMQGLASLHSLILSGLPELKSLPKGLQDATALQYLHIEYCKNLESLPEWPEVFSSLRELDISCCSKLLNLSEKMQGLTALQKLKIEKCPMLDLSRYKEEMKALFTHDQSLKISGDRNLLEAPQNATALKYLSIESCENLVTLPEWLGDITSLEELEISDCRALQGLPNAMQHLTALRKLDIRGCPLINIAEDFQKIKHVPEIYVDKQWIANA